MKALVITAALAAGLPALPTSAQTLDTIVIGTGGVTGVYFPAGGAICRRLNARMAETGLRCALTASAGSLANLDALASGDVDFAVVQADWQFHAARGTEAFAQDGPMEELRAVFSLHPEFYTVVARADDGIAGFGDLEGRRLNAGLPGSGQRATTELLLAETGRAPDDFATMTEVSSTDQAAALCAGEIDAMVYMVGHPSGAILEATSGCDARLVPVTGAGVDGLTDSNSLYRPATIPGGMYFGNDAPVRTFSIDATLVTTSRVDDATVRAVVAAVFDDPQAFREMHAAFEDLDPARMASEGASAPIHPGARAYFEEAGLLSE